MRCRSRAIPTASSSATPGWRCRSPTPRRAIPPTGDQSWTCFLSAANFKGPMAYYIPETWSKIGKLFNYPVHLRTRTRRAPGRHGRRRHGDQHRAPLRQPGRARAPVYSKIPKLQFPVDADGRAILVQDVTYYSKAALHDAFKAWRDGGPACSGRFDEKATWKPKLTTRTTRFDQGGKEDDRGGALLRHEDLRGQRLGPAVGHQRPQPEGPVPAVLQTCRR